MGIILLLHNSFRSTLAYDIHVFWVDSSVLIDANENSVDIYAIANPY